METTIIGIDAATKARRTGIAFARFLEGRAEVETAWVGACWTSVVDLIVDRIRQSDHRTLIAIDAPLGWPSALGDALPGHRAGRRLGAEPDRLFRRETDRRIRELVQKQSLDVGADRIARTAAAALGLLGRIGDRIGREIPLAWGPDFEGVAAIEVYPAGTLLAHRINARGYKGKDGAPRRRELLENLSARLALVCDTADLVASDDALDAALCVLAGVDFLRGEAVPPDDEAQALREGWIWLRRPEESPAG